MKKYNVELTEEQIKALELLLDKALKANGLQSLNEVAMLVIALTKAKEVIDDPQQNG